MAEAPSDPTIRQRLALDWKRRRLLWRAFRSRHDLAAADRPGGRLARDAILAFAVVRNEMERLPHWLDHHRRLGVARFLIVDNGSDDGSAELLAAQPDVALWTTQASYRGARFGRDWTNWLLNRHGAGHWCLTLDADELFVFPHHDRATLHDLVAELDRRRVTALGALMVELYPKGPLRPPQPLDDAAALARMAWFDAGNYRTAIQSPLGNRWVQGGVRDRVFFRTRPHRAPTLNKLPLVRWRRGFAYVNSTHSALPARLNRAWDGPGDPRLSGAVLHTKFLPSIVEKSLSERTRGQHFNEPAAFDDYYAAIIRNPDLWAPDSHRLDGWESLVRAGLMSEGGWRGPEKARS
ncbi:glycosyltransferase family 2 protein [Paracoccus sp. (in: a-proteobacteria)]|uniref:glycosyltransferase family 2 protein n=1 Tax=Paracoccus sp. TaxID=267 RepID=UPI0026E00A58|nr:glycosyltransferase family 2 protein [Paracoccus sp. (in: a-proteobacteria)]MDO5369664.1 glycosyltransferase family 2 protein [Paracoccus sp. (in: a-proteobacteria)]